jgi:flagellar hook-length control protein FliK
MSARTSRINGAGYAADKNAGAQLHSRSLGLKAEHSLAARLKSLHPGAPGQKLPDIPPGAEDAADAGTSKDKLEAARKAARAKALAAAIHSVQVAAHHDAQQKTTAAGKEQKRDAGEPGKAPSIEARAANSRAEPLIRIVDLRRAEKPHASAESSVSGTSRSSPFSDKDPSTPITLRLGAAREPFVETLPKQAPAAATHAQTPLERLREMAGSELVRATSLVLKDGGGEIRLVLKPESLGSVRIRMNVVDNAIEGRIIVDSSAVKHVFDGSVDALRRALTAEGFQTGSLQVSVGGQNADTGERQQREQAPAAVRKITAQGFERNIPGAENVSLGDLFVNLFV